MLSIFSRPRPEPAAADLYAAIVAEAREPAWYRDAGVEDTMDGRFAVLATLMALADIRLDRGNAAARAIAPRLAEVFIDDMDAQMREAGFGDPSLGKQVRHMVGALASRIERWRQAIDGDAEAWRGAASVSLYRDHPPAEREVEAGSAAARQWWDRLTAAGDGELAKGRIA